MQSSLSKISETHKSNLHVAIIMDGNGRWAAQRGLPRTDGHRAGAEAVRRTIETASACDVGTLTLYAFSCDNWQRPQPEVNALMKLLRMSLLRETRTCLQRGIRLSFIGRRDRLPSAVRLAMEAAETLTANADKLHVRIAVDYSSRDAMLTAAVQLQKQNLTRTAFANLLQGETPDVDLLIRTSGEQRLSDFLLWECAYAEFLFTKILWPDFGGAALAQAINEFHLRERRFGNIQAA